MLSMNFLTEVEKMLTIEEIIQKLSDRNLSEISRRIGLSPATLAEIANGKQINPTFQTVKKLSDYLEKNK